jgi:predicted transcriptional regulator
MGWTAVLVSIRPEWVRLIADGKKTIEVRKSYPKLHPPFKCYIYCTKTDEPFMLTVERDGMSRTSVATSGGAVVGEFDCDGICAVLGHPAVFAGHPVYYSRAIQDACMTEKQVDEYAQGKNLCGWHIDSLKIYPTPRPLNDFHQVNRECLLHGADGIPFCEKGAVCDMCAVERPPQSWCYVWEVR